MRIRTIAPVLLPVLIALATSLVVRGQGRKDYLSEEEADGQLHPAAAGGYRKPSSPGPLAWAGIRKLASAQAAVLAAMAIAVAFVHASQMGAAPVPVAATAPPPRPAGFLKVVAEPWAEVYIDGHYRETTPFWKALPVPEGDHEVELRNPYYASERRRLHLNRGQMVTLKIGLARREGGR